MSESWWRSQGPSNPAPLTLEALKKAMEDIAVNIDHYATPVHIISGEWCSGCGPRANWTHGHPHEERVIY